MDLLRCPFCGGGAVIQDYMSAEGLRGFAAACTKCSISTDDLDTPEYAAEEWNRRASGWIPVGERLPNMWEVVLVYTAGGGIGTAYRDDRSALNPEGWSWDSEDYAEGVTHWQPLPEPPV